MLYLVVCGAGPAADVTVLVSAAKERGWQPCVIATPSATRFINLEELARQTGRPVRSEHREPDEPRGSLPRADAVIVAPASFNTINKWAHGIADTYALDILAESVSYGVPIVAVPFVNTNLSNRTPFKESVARLRDEGVTVIFGPGQWESHPPGTGSERAAAFPWRLALDLATNGGTFTPSSG
ncbi:flavoprotein [Pseudonocardia acaciae]|uniref:flavoprotein n=1 Tax=Pseudonocardia acaciae TaxID=551276 RepID=UPI001FDF9C1B|nr:flavoprotein [Pseudonocardia acaciae]